MADNNAKLTATQYDTALHTNTQWSENATANVTVAGLAFTAGTATAPRCIVAATPAFLRFQNVAATAGQLVTIADVMLTVTATTIATLWTGVTLLLFSEIPSSAALAMAGGTGNGGLLTLTAADTSKLVASCALGTLQSGGVVASGTSTMYRISSQSSKAIPTSGNGANGLDLYGILVTTAPHTTVASEVYTVTLRVIRT
jgi:hypothetical protein